MPTPDGPHPPSPMEPLLTAVTDSVATGYQALEHVIEGLRESLRLQAGSGTRSPAVSAARPTAAFQGGRGAPPAASGQRGRLRPMVPGSPRHRPGSHSRAGSPSPAGLVQDLAAIAGDALGVAGTLVEDIAQAIGEQSHGSGGEECLATLVLCAPAGATATTSFTVWNTGPTLLTDVQLSATDLIGGGLPSLDHDAVAFVPAAIARIGPGKGEPVEISVLVPAEARPGLSRGVVVATPGDACAVLELTVSAAPQHVVGAPVEPPEPDLEPAKPQAPDVEPS